MNDRIPARGSGDERRLRPDELPACTMALEAPLLAGRPRSACSKPLTEVGAATAPRDAGVRVVKAPGNLWQVTHTGEIELRAGGRT
jgi:hypothetical protein